ncbi:polysaccharide deacetylase family protein [Streptomyces sp. JH34]|uniref:carbohydrate deacetylase n=1 Tax=Streptomyces sp. JH34 TaxID=2793633 RepID=UPI0023F8EA2B|nr:polysaccharide deacetylase family protein [Streptomyces sp. JH34]MDF6017228.1 polysaccharide deacetylase family protein [Streptomyces sp. JH34]
MDGAPAEHPEPTPPTGTNESLGFPPDARLLIVNCDDFGMRPTVNAAVIESVEEGIATSCSLMTVCPAAPDAVRLLRRHPAVPFGIHLTLVCESPRSPWGPLSPAEKVPSLLDPCGNLFEPTPAGRAALLGRARPDEVETEFRAQIDAVADAGLAPTHLDFHCLADGGRDDVLDLTVGLAAEYGLAVRVWLEKGRHAMRRRGLPVVDHDFLDSFSLPTEGKAEHYGRLLHELPAGLSEWAVHPALDGRETEALDDGRPVRRTDHAFLTSPEAREAVIREGITLIDYRSLQRVWSRAAGPV